MANAVALKGRYELKDTLGRGGMGVVYRAYDEVLKCDVAVKTLRETPDPAALLLFHRECEVLAALNHPNIVQILDIGEYEEAGQSTPYFVMPLLPGMPLDKLIRAAGTHLTVARRVEILAQVCRGLHAAHERGLIHRDIKPGNVFVMPDDSAVVIDFGVAHMVSSGMTGQKGTLLYMAPELFEGKAPSVLSDIFALGVMAYELFTGHRPFERATEREIIEAILHEHPTPASDLDPSVNETISRVLHKTMAKQPWHRFATAHEFSDCLGKAHRGEPIDHFDITRIRPRIQRARAAFDQGDHQFAMEIVGELEGEGHFDADLSLLKRQVDVAVRQKRVRQLLESARSRLEGEEHPLALQKIQELLAIEPDNAEALMLRSEVEGHRSERQIEGWLRLARQHVENNAFSHAREALQNVLRIRPQDTRATELLAAVDRREQDYLRVRQEKEQLYQSAVEAYQKGDVSGAMTKLERVLEIDRRTPDSSHQERGNAYQNFYNQVRSERDAIQSSYAQARKDLADQDFVKALSICDQYLTKYPGHALFQSLKFDILEQHRLQLSSYIAEIDRRVEAETDLERRVGIVSEAVDRFPDEPHFEHLLRILRERLNLVNGIVAKARYHEEQAQFGDALAQWEILRTIHARYPGLQFEIERIMKRRDQQARTEAKAYWVRQIDGRLEACDFARALDLAQNALIEFPDDGELLALHELASQGHERCEEARRLQAEGERLFDAGEYDRGLAALQQARQMDTRCGDIRNSLLDRLVAHAQRLAETDWHASEILMLRAIQLDPAHAAAKRVRTQLEDLRRQEFLNQAISWIRQSQAGGDRKDALAQVQQALSLCPGEPRLLQLRAMLETKPLEDEPPQKRRVDPERVQGAGAGVDFVFDPADIQAIRESTPAAEQHERAAAAMAHAGPAPESLPPPRARPPMAPPHADAGPAVVPQPRLTHPRVRTILIGVCAGVLLFATCIAGWLIIRHKEPTPVPGAVLIQVTGTDDARVFLDGVEKGVTRGGSLRLNVAPGTHQIQVRKEGFVDASVQRLVIEQGKQANALFTLASPVAPPAKVQVKVAPPVVRAPVAPPVVRAPVAPPAARAPVAPLAARARVSPAPASASGGNLEPTVRMMNTSDWEQPWTKDGEWFTRRGGNFVMYQVTPTTGVFDFTVRARKSFLSSSDAKVRWVLNYLDQKNYFLFELDNSWYTSTEVRDGKKSLHIKRSHGVKADSYTVRVSADPGRLVVTLLLGDRATTLDEWPMPGLVPVGRFGFYLPGDSQMWLANFRFTSWPSPAT